MGGCGETQEKRGKKNNFNTLAFISALPFPKSLIYVFDREAESTSGEIGPCPELNSTGGGRGLSAKYFWLEGGVGVLAPNHSWNGLTRPARINDNLSRRLRQAPRAALLRGFPARDPGGAQDTARAPVRRPESGQVSLQRPQLNSGPREPLAAAWGGRWEEAILAPCAGDPQARWRLGDH